MAQKKAEKKGTSKAAAKKKISKAATKKAGKAVKEGDRYQCEVCGLAVTVDEACGCADACDIVCCGEEMKPV